MATIPLAMPGMPGATGKSTAPVARTPVTTTGGRTTRRYQSWELNGRGKPTGVWPIPDGQQPAAFSEVDTVAGGVVEVREHRAEQPKPLVRQFTLGKNGRLDVQQYKDPVTGIGGKNTYEYDEKTGLMVARGEWDGQNRLRYRIEVLCDAQGRFKEEKVLDAAKRPLNRHVYHHDANGRVIRDETYVGKTLTELKGFHTLTYDAKGHILRRVWCDPKGKEKEAFCYTYDAMDRRVEMAIEKDGKRSLTARTVFDAVGRELRTEYVTPDGKPVEQAHTFDPADPETLLHAMEHLQDRLHEVVAKDPSKLEVIAQVGYAQLEAGQLDQARRIFEGLVSLAPDHAYYLAAVAAVALQQGQTRTALNYFDRALLRNKKHVMSLVGRGEVLLQLGRTEEALASLKAAMASARKGDPALKRARVLLTAVMSRIPQGKPAPVVAPAKPAVAHK